ncbi:Hypothetical protein D9617_10g072510 [Elsinoe fawcettii]|nr:Hypothetical protein D9617_10g072510 [Elsinoe fawcettii]
MTSGPSTPPPQRLHTPPTPRHGPKHDEWMPYSPRRSTRVQQKQNQELGNSTPSIAQHKATSQISAGSTSTPVPRKRTLNRQTSHQTLSPPSSPEGARQASSLAVPAQQEMRGGHVMGHDGNSDVAQTAEGAFPTPRKTPRKLRESASGSRMLNGIPYDTHPIFLASKRKARHSLYSPVSSPSTSRTKVYIDSQDRQPEMDVTKDNPFVGPRQKARAGKRPRHRLNKEEREMDELVKEGKGIIYVFRGKRIFRPYSDEREGSGDDDEPAHVYHSQSTRVAAAAGPSAERPLTRTNLEPRLLFTDYDHPHSFSEEEALTDIEEKDDTDPQPQIEDSVEAISMVNQISNDLTASAAAAVNDDTPSLAPPQSTTKGKKPSPFDSWPRQKPGAATRSTSGTKRSAPPAEGESVGKRTRSHV